MDKKTAEFLISERCKEILKSIHEKFDLNDEFKIVNYLSKNKDFNSQERAAILELLDQQKRSKSKFRDLKSWFFERSALEQATSQSVSTFHRVITRLFSKSIDVEVNFLDGTAGLGIDSYFIGTHKCPKFEVLIDEFTKKLLSDFVELDPSEAEGFIELSFIDQRVNVTSVEEDEAIFTLLNENLSEYAHYKIINSDVLEFLKNADDLDRFQFLYFDPSRRSSEIKRIESIDDYSPSPFEIMNILRQRVFRGFVGFKLAPKTPFYELSEFLNNAWVFNVSLKNEIKETFLLIAPYLTKQMFAVVLKEEKQKTEIYITNEQSKKIYDLEYKEPEIGFYLIHPAPALRSLSLIPSDLISVKQLYCISYDAPLIQSETKLSSNNAQVYEIIGDIKPDEKDVKKELQRLNYYAFSIKNYHVKLNNFNFNALSAKKGNPAYLFFVRTDQGSRCLITRRVNQE